jgi:D-amino peptidase
MHVILTTAAAALVAACSASAPAPEAAQSDGAPWTLEAVMPDTTDGIRILVLHDMEGLSGQSDPSTFFFGSPRYPEGQELLVGDVNAVVEGLYAGGATAVEIVDGHGSGNPEPDVRRDLLDPRATQVLRDSTFDAYFDLPSLASYDAVAVVGMHAKTGSAGFASHTITLGIGLVVNGQAITETELVGMSWGRVGTPVIFGSGDDRLAQDLATMPWIEFVTVKTAVGADSTVPRPVAEARADLTAKAKLAVENLRAGKVQAMKTAGPIRIGVQAVPPSNLETLKGFPGVTYEDSTATVTVDSLRQAYDVAEQMVGIASAARWVVMGAVIAEQPNGAAIRAEGRQRLQRTWFDYESGRWQPTPSAPEAAGRKYHGYR